MALDAQKPWPADKVERWPVEKLIPYARNSRTHTPAQISQIAGSIKEWGFTVPVLAAEDGTIIAGHARTQAAQKLGLAEIPVMVARGWTEAQKRAYVIADNKLTLNGGFDNDMLVMELGDLFSDGFNLELTGFSKDELSGLLQTDTGNGMTDQDEVPSSPVDPVTRLQDIWILGRHRLMCGDSASQDDVARLMQEAKADICFTSPPYAQQRDYKSGGIGDWDALMRGVFANLPVKHEAQILVNLGLVHLDGEWSPYWDAWIEWMRSAGWRRFGWYVWDKLAGMPGDWNGRLAPSHEWVFHFNRVSDRPNKTKAKQPGSIEYNSHGTGIRGKNGKMSGVSNRAASLQPNKIPDSVIRVVPHKARGGVENEHPAVFPVDLVSEMLTAFSDPDDSVYEPFSGSGTQIISAQKNGRSCYAMEIASEYCDVAVKRWQNFTGQTAKLEATGQTFDEIAAERPMAA